jgi:hypothetical protein
MTMATKYQRYVIDTEDGDSHYIVMAKEEHVAVYDPDHCWYTRAGLNGDEFLGHYNLTREQAVSDFSLRLANLRASISG